MYELLYMYCLTTCSLPVLFKVAYMYGSSLHAEVFCLAQPSSVKLSHLDSATSLARFSFARCTVVQLGLHMDSPSQQQRRIAHVDPSTSDTQAFRQTN